MVFARPGPGVVAVTNPQMITPATERVLAELATGDEHAILQAMYEQLQAVLAHNQLKTTYYEAHHSLRDLQIALPPALRGLDTVVGWPGMVVDVLD